MRKFLQIMSTALAFWLLITSVGATFDIHFCNGEIFSIGINASAEKCSGLVVKDTSTDKPVIDKSSCCDHFSGYFHSDIDFVHKLKSNDDVQKLLSFFHKAEIPKFIGPKLCDIYLYYSPPDIDFNKLALFSFLRL